MLDLFTYDPIVLCLLAGLVAISAGFIAALSVKRYELAIFLVVLSPWISALFVPNAPENLTGSNPTIGSYIRFALLILMGNVGIITVFRQKLKQNQFMPFQFVLLGTFLALTLMSTGYSIDQRHTFIRSAFFILFFCFLLGLSSWLRNEYQLQKTINAIFWALFFCLVMNIIAMPLFPNRVWWFMAENRFQGLWSQPNEMGAFCMVFYPVLAWKYEASTASKKRLIVLCAIATLILHFLTGSRTTLISAALGMITWFLITKRPGKLVIFSTGLMVATVVFFLLRPPGFMREGYEKVAEFTGRTEIWTAAVTLAIEKPILGYGYEVGGKIFEDQRFYNREISQWSGNPKSSLHNGYLSVFIGLGIVGFLLFYFTLFIPFIRRQGLLKTEYKAFWVTILVMSIVTNLTESFISGPTNIGSSVLWIAWVMVGKMLISDGKTFQQDAVILKS